MSKIINGENLKQKKYPSEHNRVHFYLNTTAMLREIEALINEHSPEIGKKITKGNILDKALKLNYERILRESKVPEAKIIELVTKYGDYS